MRALVYHGPRSLKLEERRQPNLVAHDDVLIRPILTGICGTDRAVYLGHAHARHGVTLGHECVAVVDSAGPAATDRIAPGTRVVLNPTLWCGRCRQCRQGKTRFCDEKAALEIGVALDGAFADVLVAPVAAIYPLPDEMPNERAVLIEPLACVLTAASSAQLAVSDTVAVIGGGPIGLLWALVAQRLATDVVVIERDPYRRRFASELGPTAGPEALAASRGEFTVIVDTTGTEADVCVATVADGGRVVLMGCHAGGHLTTGTLELTARSISLIGSSDCHAGEFADAIAYMSRLNAEVLVTHVAPLDAFSATFEMLATGGGPTRYAAVKAAITIGGN